MPDVSHAQIGGPWDQLVHFVSESLMRSPGVKSVYIRGSIPRGLAVLGTSDADFIYFSEEDLKSVEDSIEKESLLLFPFCKGIELVRLNHDSFIKVHDPQKRPYFQMLLKTQALHLAGEDIVDKIEPFKVDRELVSHVFALKREYKKLPEWLEEDRRNGKEIETRKWFSRRIVRSGLEITMNRCPSFTRDLFLCFEQFSQFYPGFRDEMWQVLVNCLNGNEDPLRYEYLVDLLHIESSGLLV